MSKIDNFIEKANKRHSNKYNYSRVKYTSSKEKVEIICDFSLIS